MKKLLLTGIAALFLVTGAAHASGAHYYQCGEFGLYTQYFTGGAGNFEISGPGVPGVDPRTIKVTWSKRGCPRINGRRCIETDEDGKPVEEDLLCGPLR